MRGMRIEVTLVSTHTIKHCLVYVAVLKSATVADSFGVY